MLHELKLMRGRGEIKVPEDMSENEFEEIMKKIDKHFIDDGVSIHHPYIRGRITNTSSIEHINKFFQHIYATSNNPTNVRARLRNTQNRRAQAAANRLAARARIDAAAFRRAVPLSAANEGRSWARERTARSAIRNVGRTVARAAANSALARSSRRRTRSRSSSRSQSGTRV
jgi:hypothetical protein